MAITKTVNLDVQSNLDESTKSVGSLKSQLREAILEVQSLSEKFGDTSKEAIEAAKRAAELKDKIEDANDAIKSFKGEGAFTATATALGSVASGFSAVEGAMALIGDQSKDVELAILKVQSAMAIATGLQGLEDAGRSFKQMKVVAVDAFQSIKAAIGSTGIGLFVVALGAIVTYWDDISKAISGANEEQKAYQGTQEEVTKSLAKAEENLISVKIALDQAKQGTLSKKEALKLYNEKLGESLGKTDSLAVAEERLSKNTASFISSQMAKAQAQIFLAKASEAAAKAASGEDVKLDWWDQAKVAIANAVSAGEGAAMQSQLVTKNIANNQKEIALYTNLATKEYKKAAEEDNKINADSINTRYDAQKKAAEEASAKAKADREKQIAEEKARKEKELQEFKDFQKILRDAEAEDGALKIGERLTREQNQLDSLNAIAEEQDAIDAARTEKERQNAEARIEIAEREKTARLKLLDAVANGLSLAAGELGAATAEGKAAAVAAATISTYTAIAGQLQAFSKVPIPGYAIAQAIVTGATGLLQVKKILEVKVPEGGGGSAGSAPSMGGIAAPAAPSFNVVGNSGINQVAQVMSNKGMPPVQAYVVASNVTSAQSLNRNIVSNATLG